MVGASEQRSRYLEGYKRALEEQGLSVRSKKVIDLKREIENLRRNNIDSLEQVLRYSMLTILNASEQTDSHKGQTWLKATSLLRKAKGSTSPFPSLDTDEKLCPFDSDSYLGWYHTDYAIPSDYFCTVAPDRPAGILPFSLDFSYIHNPAELAFKHMSKGTRTRGPV
jgi:hypothetical protein